MGHESSSVEQRGGMVTPRGGGERGEGTVRGGGGGPQSAKTEWMKSKYSVQRDRGVVDTTPSSLSLFQSSMENYSRNSCRGEIRDV